jgi:signal peptidase I
MSRPKSSVRVILEPLLIAVALAVVVRFALFRIYSIPSASMWPTLAVGDQIVVTPYRAPFSSAPRRGDVVVFRMPGRDTELMVKRIVAVPGDLIEAVDGELRVSGLAVSEPYVALHETTGGLAPQVVPPGSYFVLGDHRADSLDSRNWGVLPASQIAGRARFILWSSGDGVSGSVAHASTRDGEPAGGHSIRWNRTFKPIH